MVKFLASFLDQIVSATFNLVMHFLGLNDEQLAINYRVRWKKGNGRCGFRRARGSTQQSKSWISLKSPVLDRIGKLEGARQKAEVPALKILPATSLHWAFLRRPLTLGLHSVVVIWEMEHIL